MLCMVVLAAAHMPFICVADYSLMYEFLVTLGNLHAVHVRQSGALHRCAKLENSLIRTCIAPDWCW